VRGCRPHPGDLLLRRDVSVRPDVPLPAVVRLPGEPRPEPVMTREERGAAVEALIRDHRGALFAFVRRRAGHLVDPDDVVQQATLKAVAASASLVDASRGRAWLFRITRNALADALRAAGVPREEQPVDATAEAPEAPSEACQCSLIVARTLKPEYAVLLERFAREDVPITTLAAELGLTPDNAMVRLHRARAALREALRQHCGTTSLRACLDCVCGERGCCAG
jgi:RNA polymerase sigma-70 factor (ECF subfamily)